MVELFDDETTPYGIDMVNALDVPDYNADSGISVCVIDSGYDLGHEDLQTTNVDGVGELCVTSPCPWDEDTSGHGTHVTGTIAAIGGNSVGVMGVVRNGLMPIYVVRVFDAGGSAWTSDVVEAMYECDNFDANVVNMSLGSFSYDSAYETAIDTILANNDQIIYVAAAGNAGFEVYSYPASIPQFVSVGSVTSTKLRSSFSSYNDEVDLVGPGSDVYSTVPGGGYQNKSGTSMAAPHVVGVAALVWSYFPDLTASEIRATLESTAEDLGNPGRDNEYGHGLVNAALAISFLTPINCTDYSWTPIANDPDSVIVGSTLIYTEEVDLGFKFFWLGGTSFTEEVVVSHNGQININTNDVSSNCCSADPIGDYNKPRIAIVQDDLEGGGGFDWDVWMKKVPGEVLISWESGTFYPNVGLVNAQVRIFSAGEVVICYGSGDVAGNSFAAGIEGKENDNLWLSATTPVVYPLSGSPFGSDGVASTWPEESLCYCFDTELEAWETSFESTLTLEPSVSPTIPPTTSGTDTCCDPEWPLSISGNVVTCDEVSGFASACSNPNVASYCKSTCSSCAEYECIDSTVNFIVPSGNEVNCDILASLDADDVSFYCDLVENLQCTCPATCGVCD